jgi:pilus assembly protein CpaC
VLAEPTLIALSGQTAEFLAGGEFPILVPQGDETISVEYKPFGVGLSFTPTVLDTGKISMKLAPSVSELDYSSGVQYSGFTVPGITTRRASTTIELGDGQSFAIAGLLSETTRDSAAKFPGLGDIPVLGTLFRSKEFLKNETELIIIATPHLVKPVNGEELPLPTDFYKEPNDLEFYLLGLMEGQEYPLKTVTGQELDGQFGHAQVQPEPGDVQEVGRVQAQVQTEG